MSSFFERPILNSPYSAPKLHHALDADGQPLDVPPIEGRRRSELITPVPSARRRPQGKQKSLPFQDETGLSSDAQEYNPTPIINEIRSHVESWRALPNPADWGVTPATARLLTYWRSHNFEGVRPFFCQVEAVETIVWLTEVAPKLKRTANIREHLKASNQQANPELFRLGMKMATGAGKTTVMAMLIAWQTVNAVRSPSSGLFSKAFLIVTPGITIRDRLRVLLPEDSESYYRTRELVPADMLGDIAKAKIVITNYHAFKRRETTELSKVGRSLLQGRGEAPVTIETEGQMLQRACKALESSQQYRRHQRRGASLLPRKAAERGGSGTQGRGKGRGEEKQRGGAPVDFRHRGAEASQWRARGLSTSPRRRSSSAARAMPKARCSLGSSAIFR